MNLAINETSDQSMHMLKDDGFVDLILCFVSLKLGVPWKLYSSKLCLYQEGDLVGCKVQVHLDWKSDPVSLIDLLVQAPFTAFEPNVMEFISLSENGKLRLLAAVVLHEENRLEPTISETFALLCTDKMLFIVSNLT